MRKSNVGERLHNDVKGNQHNIDLTEEQSVDLCVALSITDARNIQCFVLGSIPAAAKKRSKLCSRQTVAANDNKSARGGAASRSEMRA